MVQWLRICLAMQGTLVRPLVWEDPTFQGTAKPVHHDYRSPRTQSLCSTEKPLQQEVRAPQLEKALQQRRSSIVKIKNQLLIHS